MDSWILYWISWIIFYQNEALDFDEIPEKGNFSGKILINYGNKIPLVGGFLLISIGMRANSLIKLGHKAT